ncbi:MAG: transposase [Clostridium sp.]|nr:transposase [Clostridium sp.]
MFTFLDQKGLFFLMRVSSAFKLANATSTNDSSITYKANGISKNLREIKIELPDGSIETLVTNIFDNTITPLLFKELYFLHWGIECKYKKLKYSIEIEELSGNKPVTIHQDFYASIYISMVTSIIKKESDIAIAKELVGKNKIIISCK